MSFILDALKKSEIERQQQNTDFNHIQKRKFNTKKPRWLWVIVILLTINLVVLAGLFLKVNLVQIKTENPVIENNVDPINKIIQQEKFSKQIDSSGEQVFNQRSETQNYVQKYSAELLPTIDEVRLENINVPELHLDIHVYSDRPKDRFVFINMTKLKEGSQLNQGLKIIEIMPDGVILDDEGYLFILPRE